MEDGNLVCLMIWIKKHNLSWYACIFFLHLFLFNKTFAQHSPAAMGSLSALSKSVDSVVAIKNARKLGWLHQLIPHDFEWYVSALGGLSFNLSPGLAMSNATAQYTVYNEPTSVSYLAGGISLGLRLSRNSIESNLLFTKTTTGYIGGYPIHGSSPNLLFSPDVSFSFVNFSTDVAELSVKYKYLLYANPSFVVQVGGLLGTFVTSNKVAYFASRDMSYEINRRTFIDSLWADTRTNTYFTFFVGGVLETSLQLSKRMSLGLAVDLQYYLKPFEGTLNYVVRQQQIDGTNNTKTVLEDKINVDLFGHFLLVRPLLKLTYHFPLRLPKQIIQPQTQMSQQERTSPRHLYVGMEFSPSFNLNRSVHYKPNPQGYFVNIPILKSPLWDNELGMMPYFRVFLGIEKTKGVWEFAYAIERFNPMLIPIAFHDPLRQVSVTIPEDATRTNAHFLEASYLHRIFERGDWKLYAGGLAALQLMLERTSEETISVQQHDQTLQMKYDIQTYYPLNLVLGLKTKMLYDLSSSISMYLSMQVDAVPYPWITKIRDFSYYPTSQTPNIAAPYMNASTFLARWRPAIGLQFRFY